MIDDVIIKKLITHADERGFFREILRVTDDFFHEGFGQLSQSRLFTGTTKAWHIHKKQIDWWYVSSGVIKAVLFDTRPDSATYKTTMEIIMGDNQDAQVLRIPTGVAHGYKCIMGPADVFYITSGVYNPDDEGRIPHDDKEINYDWRKLPSIT